MPRIDELVAPPGFSPREWQSPAPQALFDRGMPVGASADLERIIALPRRKPLNVDQPESAEVRALVEYEMQKYGRYNPNCQCHEIDPRRSCITRLLPIQAWALYEMSLAGGLLGSIPVGAGKTILGILSPLALGVRLGLLLIPPSLVDQIIIDYQMLQQHFRVPSIVVEGGAGNEPRLRNVMNCDNSSSLRVLPYSRLSQPESSDWLENLGPDAIIADECDALKDLTSARSMRVMRYFSGRPGMTEEQRNARRALTKFCGWTGSITDHSLSEFSHLLALALKMRSPVPLDPEIARDWGRCLDAVPSPCPPGELLRLCTPGESVRDAFRRRLSETLGFVITTSSDVRIEATEGRRASTVEIVVQERVAPPLPAIIQEALAKVRNFQRPDTLAGSLDDEELIDAMSQAKCAQEIATGCFYRWIFPRGEPTALILEWFAARKLWNKELRAKLLHGEQYLDSPNLCERAARRAYGELPPDRDRPEWVALHWPRWARVKDRVEPQTQAVRLHPFLAEDAAHWGSQNRGIIWYGMVEFAQWVSQLSGLTVHGGGPRAGELLRAERGDRSIIASIKSHGRGRDGLQHMYFHQLVANTPASARAWQQCLDSSTEVLTTRGWMGIDDDWSGVSAAAYAIEDGSIRWAPASYMQRPLAGEAMYGIRNPHLDIRVTAGHRMIVERSQHVSRTVASYQQREFVNANDMPRRGRIPLAGMEQAVGVPLTDDQLVFLGLFMSDGNLSVSNKTIRLFQSERNPEIIKLIEQTTAACGFKTRRSVETRPSNFGPRSPLHQWCISHGVRRNEKGLRGWGALEPYVDKNFPMSLDAMTREQLLKFLHGYWAGDGNKTPGTYTYDRYDSATLSIATRRKLAADRIQSLCVRRGMRCNISNVTNTDNATSLYMLRISPDVSTWSIQTSTSDSRPIWKQLDANVDERVWCVEVATGAIVTRRDGKVAIVGNCLGRLHRRGQRAQEVLTEVYLHTEELEKSFEQAIRRGEYVRDVMGEQQKLLSGFRTSGGVSGSRTSEKPDLFRLMMPLDDNR